MSLDDEVKRLVDSGEWDSMTLGQVATHLMRIAHETGEEAEAAVLSAFDRCFHRLGAPRIVREAVRREVLMRRPQAPDDMVN